MEDLRARLEVCSGGRQVATMAPAKLFYKRQQQPATRVAIRSTPLADLYIVLAGSTTRAGWPPSRSFSRRWSSGCGRAD